ncbi:MAG: cation:proton antiporter [Nevskia sp.]|nr:cation:proton antiporter [Nevskia sp.]MCK9383933.1 cation:proton antiporter [Nevskia sp.]
MERYHERASGALSHCDALLQTLRFITVFEEHCMDFSPTWPLHVTPLIAFGLMLIVGAGGGYAAHRFSWLPSITGFMVVGFICGPSVLGLLSHEAIVQSRILIDVSLALILYRLGLSLDLKHLWQSPRLFFVSLLESGVTFILVFSALYWFDIPPAIAALVSAIAISSSPAVLLHVAHEVGARGPVTETAKTLVALNNLIAFIAFSAILPALHYSTGSGWQTIVFQPAYQLIGSLIVGVILAFGLHAIAVKTHRATQYKLALVFGTIMIAVGIAGELKLSMLFVALVIGVVVKSLERETIVSDLEFGSAFELIFIVLFVFAGAGLHVRELIEFAPAVLALIVTRTLAKALVVTAASPLLKVSARKGVASGLLLIPMAGLAIGLALTSSNLFPQLASTISAIVLGAVTVFETMGPPIAAFAFRFAGEAATIAPAAAPTTADEPPQADAAPESET